MMIFSHLKDHFIRNSAMLSKDCLEQRCILMINTHSRRSECKSFRTTRIEGWPSYSARDFSNQALPHVRPVRALAQSQRTRKEFGIIAAQEEHSRLIGINGTLPWDIPEDREYFINMTSNKVFIIGKNTFYESESSDFSHLDHLRHVIVVSKSMKKDEFMNLPLTSFQREKMNVVRSFQKALDLSEKFRISEENKEFDGIDCWIGGGEQLYKEALQHPNAFEVRLTDVHCETKLDLTSFQGQVAFFPPKCRWENKFRELSELEKVGHNEKNGVSYTFSVYQKH